MKLEKREITLNEYDSLKDVFFMEKNLLRTGIEGLAAVVKKESRSECLRWMKEVCEDMFFALDLMNGSSIHNLGEKEK